MAVKSINELEIYREAMRIGEDVWNEVSLWDQFSKIAVGSQLVRAVDSIAANLSEGHGRYHYKENQNFCYYSRGSLTETQTFIEKAVNRKLIDTETARKIYRDLDSLHKRLNAYIHSIGPQGTTTNA